MAMIAPVASGSRTAAAHPAAAGSRVKAAGVKGKAKASMPTAHSEVRDWRCALAGRFADSAQIVRIMATLDTVFRDAVNDVTEHLLRVAEIYRRDPSPAFRQLVVAGLRDCRRIELVGIEDSFIAVCDRATAESLEDEIRKLLERRNGWSPTDASLTGGRGIWRDGRHVLAPRDARIEGRLFGAAPVRAGRHARRIYDETRGQRVLVECGGATRTCESFFTPAAAIPLVLVQNLIELHGHVRPTEFETYALAALADTSRDAVLAEGRCDYAGRGVAILSILARMVRDGPTGTRRDRPYAIIVTDDLDEVYDFVRRLCYRTWIRPALHAAKDGQLRTAQALQSFERHGCDILVVSSRALMRLLQVTDTGPQSQLSVDLCQQVAQVAVLNPSSTMVDVSGLAWQALWRQMPARVRYVLTAEVRRARCRPR